MPSVVIAPLVGHDPACYRLGYGGGFFDRTLAKLRAAAPDSPPLKIGVGDGSGTIPSIRPQPRSEEHTSELQSLMRISYAVFCLKKKKQTTTPKHLTALYLNNNI